jgi:hypothetical protein
MATKIVAKTFIFPFQHTNNAYYDILYTAALQRFPKTLYPGGIRTWVFLFLRRMRCPLRHAARAQYVRTFCSRTFRLLRSQDLEDFSLHAKADYSEMAEQSKNDLKLFFYILQLFSGRDQNCPCFEWL